MNFPSIPTLLSTALLTTLLSACGSDSNDSVTPSGDIDDPVTPVVDIHEVQIDATAGGFSAAADDPKKKYTYFDLDTGKTIELTDAQAMLSGDWDIAFKRTNPKLNGGDSGPGNTTAAVADTQDEYYSANEANASVFLNATAEQELESFKAITSADTLTFSADAESPEMINDGGEKSWFSYNPANHTISANPDAWNIIRGADGQSFAKIHVTDIVQADNEITVEMFIQGNGETAFNLNPSSFTASFGDAGGSACYDFDTQAEVDCATEASNWDIQIEIAGRSWNIWTNGGLRGAGSDGGRFGTVGTDSIANYPSALSIPNFFADAPTGTLLDSSTRWYAYSLQGNHKIWPNYRVYIVDTGTKKYKLQVLKYYNEAGTSGFITLRYADL